MDLPRLLPLPLPLPLPRDSKEEESVSQKLLETTGMSALMSTLGEAQDQLKQRGQKLEDLGEKTERLEKSADEFEKLAKKLNEEDQVGGRYIWTTTSCWYLLGYYYYRSTRS